MDDFLSERGFDSISILHNDAYLWEGVAIAGTRGWTIEEEDDKIRGLFTSAATGDQVLAVSIGGEIPVEGVDDCSMVTANYFINGEKAGSIGVLGPTRMSYDKTVSLMKFIADELGKVMSDKTK